MKNVGVSRVYPINRRWGEKFLDFMFFKFSIGRGVHHGGTQRDTGGSEKHRFQRVVRKEYVMMKI